MASREGTEGWDHKVNTPLSQLRRKYSQIPLEEFYKPECLTTGRHQWGDPLTAFVRSQSGGDPADADLRTGQDAISIRMCISCYRYSNGSVNEELLYSARVNFRDQRFAEEARSLGISGQ